MATYQLARVYGLLETLKEEREQMENGTETAKVYDRMIQRLESALEEDN